METKVSVIEYNTGIFINNSYKIVLHHKYIYIYYVIYFIYV